ncbi:MAG: hypothetical protein Fur007_01560 [Rhodoferax sp.]
MATSPIKPHIVGVGASAGGLEAISQFIGTLKPETPCAYVVLQHLSPTHRSMMVEILARETHLTVLEAKHGDIPQTGHIYVVPSNFNAILREGKLQLQPAPPEVVPKPSINQFLISLAAEEGDAAIGIVLSGTGSDGTAGLRAIQAAGGYTFVQKPESAKYDGMPRAAIEAGVVDHILTPEAIAQRLPELLDLPAQEAETPPADLLEQLLSRVREKLKVDFSGYKVGTLLRRVRRRELATGNADLASYLAWVQQHPSELDLLARDILISVTAFFRDREAFDALSQAINQLCSTRAPGSEIRAWVAGCASGEEAYSIAMLLADALGDRLAQFRIQIFATDIDEDALNAARRGVYPAAALAELKPHQVERHFRPTHGAFEVAKHLRDMIVFARHNLVSDPPFLRLDLVSCRNVLIYFDTPLQAKVLQTFHFGLNAGGELFLGRSESVAQAEALFTPQDRRSRLFRKSGESLRPPVSAAALGSLRGTGLRREHKAETLLSALAAHHHLTVLLCDSDGVIIHTAGQVERHVQVPAGAARLTLSESMLPPLRGELLALLHRCRQTGHPQRGRRRRLGTDWLSISVDAVSDSGGMFLVLIQPETGPDAPSTGESATSQSDVRQVEDELTVTREHLQALVEEMATANEEMQALNEEAQASNEELQATNEELEAANEELQATNEELISLNEELNVKTVELARLTDEYAHLYDALQFPILVFDQNQRLLRYNAPAGRRLDLRPTALGQPLERLRLPPELTVLPESVGRVLAHLDRDERTLQAEGRTLQLSVTPGLGKTGALSTLVVTLIDVSDVARAQADLAESQARLSALMDSTTMIFAMRDIKGAYLYANPRFLDYFDLADKPYRAQTHFTLFAPDLAASLWAADVQALRERQPVAHTLNLSDTRHGARWLHCVHQVLIGPNGQPNAFLLEAEDVTNRHLAEDQLRITARVFDQAGEAIVVTDANGVIQTVNAAFTRITGYTVAESVGQPITLLKSGRHSADSYHAMWDSLIHNGAWQGEIWNKRKNGELYPEWLTINRVDNEQGQTEHFVAVFSDITQIKNAQRRNEFLATHDTLTGLPNRALFHDRLKHALAAARRRKSRVALLFIDLDNFKTVNDTLGHDVGDLLLKSAAQRLREAVRDVDTIARLGGDEFTAVLSESDLDTAQRVARRIVDDLSASFRVQDRDVFVSCSVGVAFFPEDATDATALLQAADSAMYRAKDLGRNRVEFFKPELQVRLLRRATIENALRAAIETPGRLRLVFQPKFSCADERHLAVAEALLRWRDPELGDVSPADFIPVAEASGLIQGLCHVVLGQLLDHLKGWVQLGLRVPPLAINVSPRTVRNAEFARQTLLSMESAGVDPSRIVLEITEGALLESSSAVEAYLISLHRAGVRFSVDDFGTGYSSLAYLKRLPLHELKIDKTFVDGLGCDPSDEAIAQAVLQLARALGLTTVAEGVETQGQLDWLKARGCDLVQGYLLARPLEADSFEDLMAREH